MNIEEQIEKFNEDNGPFYLVDHGSEYSLCLLLGGTPTAAAEYGQYAFDHYAESVGKPIEENGWLTYGDGYDWECVFKEAFEKDPAFHKVHFDCESSGFFCISEDLSALESFGRSFKSMVENREEFTKLVESAMHKSDLEKKEALQGVQTVKDLIEKNPNCSFSMVTPMGYVVIKAEEAPNLLTGASTFGHNGFGGPPQEITAQELLSKEVECWNLEEENGSIWCYAFVGYDVEEAQNPISGENQEPIISM